MKAQKVQFTETVLRDANQSLIATRLPYDKFDGILEEMDKAGYYSIECWGGATFDSCLRFLNEDPWERLRKIRKKVKNTKLQMLLQGTKPFGLPSLSRRRGKNVRQKECGKRHRHNPYFRRAQRHKEY